MDEIQPEEAGESSHSDDATANGGDAASSRTRVTRSSVCHCYRCGEPIREKYVTDLCPDCARVVAQLYDVNHRRRVFLHE